MLLNKLYLGTLSKQIDLVSFFLPLYRSHMEFRIKWIAPNENEQVDYR